MAEITIDHIVSLTVFFAATLLFANLFLQTMNTAIIYQKNHQVALKASDVLNSILLSSGLPKGWGESNNDPLTFGLHQPETGLLSLSSFSLLRLIYPENVVTYSGTQFNNISISESVSVFMPVARYVDYATVSRLLGINGSYGFHITVEPTLTVTISQMQPDPLRLKVQVEGPGGVCSGASINCYVYYAIETEPTPSIGFQANSTLTNSQGIGYIEFQAIDTSDVSYSALAQVYLSGLRGTGFYSSPLSEDKFLETLITNYENRAIALVHKDEIPGNPPPNAEVHYNLTYVLPTQDYGFRAIQIENSTGIVNKGAPAYIEIPSFDSGILIITYKVTGNDFATIMMPWGIGALGISVDFGIDSSTSPWVATQLRQVIIGQFSYQVRFRFWSLTS